MKESFIVRKKYQEQIKLLNTEQKAQLLDAIFSYQLTQSLPSELDPLVSMLLSIMINERTKDDHKYSETLQKRIEGGKKGGRPSRTWKNGQKPGGFENNLEDEKETLSPPVYDSVSDSVSDSDTNSSSNEEEKKNKKNKTKKTKVEYSPEFESFWKAYPKKKGKQKAWDAWTLTVKSGVSEELLIKKAGEYATEISLKKIEEHYIKRAQGWLNDGRYDDDYYTGSTGSKPNLDNVY